MGGPVVRRSPISERYRPHSLDDVLGSFRARTELRAWAATWNAGRLPARRAVVLAGPPGVGKTSTALALAEENGWSLVEMNASDARNEGTIQQVAGRASITHTLEGNPSGQHRNHALILLDEADCLSGRRSEPARAAPAPATLREFLRGRYGKIEALNAAWGLGAAGGGGRFAEWDDLPKSAGRAAWTRLPAAQRDLADWKGGSRPPDLTDRGGLGAIAKLVRSTRQPLVLTVNDESVLTRYSPVFRSAVLRIPFSRLKDPDVAARLASVAGRERIPLAPGVTDAIVRKARGDLRAALNDLEAVAPLPPGPDQLAVLGLRDLTSDIEEMTAESLTAHRYYRSVEVRDRVDAPPDDLFPWIEENIPAAAPDAHHLEEAIRVLASADLLLRRASRYRVWSLWSYASELLTGGVGLTIRDAPAPPRERVYFPEFLGGMGQSRFVRGTRDSVALKAGHRFHMSKAKARLVLVPFLEAMTSAGSHPRAREEVRAAAGRLISELELTPEEVGFLARAEPESATVARLLAPSPADPVEEPAPASSNPEEPSSTDAASPPRKVQRSLSDFDGQP